MIVLTFQPRFAPLVENGTKPNTIRCARKRLIKAGDILSLREWTGRPYGSAQRILRAAVCTGVDEIHIGSLLGDPGEVFINGIELSTDRRASLARSDGFTCMTDMLDWFEDAHGLPFHGVLIRWDPKAAQP